MMRASAWCLLLSGCSLLFDPAKVSPECPSIDPPVPTMLEAVSGEGRGLLRWRWPQVAVSETRLCTTVPGAGERCDVIDVSDCDGGTCEHVQTTLSDGVRVSGRVQSLDQCSRSAFSEAVSASPIDASNPDEWILSQESCISAQAGFSGGVLSLEQQGGGCTTSLTVTDEGWGSFTLDAELRISSSGENIKAGFSLAENASGHRLRATAVVPSQIRLFSADLEERLNGTTRVVANGTHFFSSSDWTHVRLVVNGPVVSWQQGPPDAGVVELLRWTDQVARTGRFGLAGDGPGRFEVRGLRVLSRATPLPAASSDVTFRFGVDGGLPGARSLGLAPKPITCPSWPAACATCAPTATCAVFSRSGLLIDYSLVALPQPPGIDPARPFTITARFALPPDGGTGNTQVVDSLPFSLLDSTPTQTKVAGQVVGGGLAPATWHLVSWTFAPDAGLRATVDGTVAAPVAWPATGNRFVGALQLGNTFNSSDIVLNEVTFAQP
jgi:hypothetical protein